MNFGIVADEIDRDFAKAIRIGTELGIRRYEIRHLLSGRFPACTSDEMREVERVIGGEGIEVTGISPGLFKLTDTQAGFDREMNEIYPRAADWAKRWNVPAMIVFGFHKPDGTEANAAAIPRGPAPLQVIDWLTQAAERAAADGVQLIIEPEPICWADSSTAAVHMIERAAPDTLKINYDPGNVAWLEQRDPIDEFRVAAKYIANVHVKDLRPLEPGATRPAFVPVGQGMLDFRAHFRALRDFGFNGPMSLEPHMDGHPETIRRCKEAAELAWSQS